MIHNAPYNRSLQLSEQFTVYKIIAFKCSTKVQTYTDLHSCTCLNLRKSGCQHQNERKYNLSDHGTAFVARSTNLSSWVLNHNKFYSKTRKKKCERQLFSQKRLFDERGQRRMSRVVGVDRKDTLTQITTLYSRGEQNGIYFVVDK